MKNKRILSLFFLLLLLSVSFPQIPEHLSEEPIEVTEELGDVDTGTGLYYAVQSLLILLMITAAVIAIAGYVFAPLFGAETRAKIQVWSGSLLAAVGVSALIIIMFGIFVPFFEGRGEISATDIQDLIVDISVIMRNVLVFVIVTMVVISAAAYTIGQLFGAETRAKANVWSQMTIGAAIVATIIYVLVFYLFAPIIMEGFIFNVAGRAVNLNQFLVVIVAVIFIVSSLTLITYLAAKIFKVSEWEAYLNIEMSNLINSFLILLFIMGFFAVSSVIAIGITKESSPPLAAVEVIRGLTNSVLEATMDVYTIQACTSVLATYHRRIGEAVLTPTFRVFPGIDTFVSITNVLALGFVMVYGSLNVQIALLNFIDAIVVPFILPAGLVLRFFPPTKEAGAFLIALAFGFQIVFPTVYYINAQALNDIGVTEYRSDIFPISALCGMSYAYFTVPPVLLQGLYAPLASTLQKIFSEGVVHGLSMSIFIPLLRNLSAVSLLALFAPALSMILTIASINAMTKFIVMKG